jgi:hypothetical protein
VSNLKRSLSAFRVPRSTLAQVSEERGKGWMEGSGAVLRVERGEASEEELAALTVVLLALRAHDPADTEELPTLGWNWWERSEGYAPPLSWR